MTEVEQVQTILGSLASKQGPVEDLENWAANVTKDCSDHVRKRVTAAVRQFSGVRIALVRFSNELHEQQHISRTEGTTSRLSEGSSTRGS